MAAAEFSKFAGILSAALSLPLALGALPTGKKSLPGPPGTPLFPRKCSLGEEGRVMPAPLAAGGETVVSPELSTRVIAGGR